MIPLLALGLFGASLVWYVYRAYQSFQVNLAAAKRSGIPYIITPVYVYNPFWLITHKLWFVVIRRLPRSWSESWIEYVDPDFVWSKKYAMFKECDSDLVLTVSPDANTLYVADPESINSITVRRNDFPKPTHIYRSLDIYGKNVVSTEGALWRHHRKITSPPFTERNNQKVWRDSLVQAESMMAGWISKDQDSSGTVWNVATEAMRLSLYVISSAGFGVRLYWPHEQEVTPIPEGHTMTYKEALETLLHNILTLILIPKWVLKYSPMRSQKKAYEAYVEWGKYMRELYENKRAAVKNGLDTDGMDLMGALVKGAGMTEETLNADSNGDEEKGGKQLLTDEEIFGNAFVFILAGHETAANTIHFATMLLAMNPASQRRLQHDLDSILGDRSVSEWDYDNDLTKLFGSMCGAVMNEELRIIPPALQIPKMVPAGRPQGLTTGGKSVNVPGGAYVFLNTLATHTNPKYWPHTSEEDLNAFRPERWLLDPTKENTSTEGNAYEEEEGLDFDGPDKRPDTAASLFRPAKGAYVPFSDGYRSCLGRRFAQVEIMAVLAVMFKNYSVELDVSEHLSDEAFAKASEEEKRDAWTKADARAKYLLKTGMATIITIQMRKGKVPFRFVKRGKERFAFMEKA